MEQKLLYEGKAKKVYETDEDNLCIIEYKNTATAFNGQKKQNIEDKGMLNCAFCTKIYTFLQDEGVPTHFVKSISSTQMLVKKVQIIPLEIIVRNIAAGSFSKRYNVVEGTKLCQPAFEMCYKDDSLGDPMINTSQILALRLAKREQIDKIMTLSAKVNQLLIGFFGERGIELVDFKLEFGTYHGEIVLADEISPDTCRLWDKATLKKLDKDRFRQDLGGVSEAYKEVYNRIKGE